jgi:hypothetical protein
MLFKKSKASLSSKIPLSTNNTLTSSNNLSPLNDQNSANNSYLDDPLVKINIKSTFLF